MSNDEKVATLGALIAEADEDFERGDFVTWTPTLMDEILAEAREAIRHGESIKLPEHLRSE